MNRFKDILLYLDPENAPLVALKRVEAIAAVGAPRITALHVLDDDRAGAASTDMQGRLEAIVAPLRAAGVEVSTRVTRGRSYLEIIREVLRGGHDLVVKTIEHEDWFKRAFFGTTDRHLLRKCPSPVLLVDPNRARPAERVLVAVDLWDEDEGLALNEACLELGRSIALLDDAELHIVYVERYYGGEQTKARWQALMQRWGGPKPRTRFHILHGDPREAIPQRVDEADIDLLVMGTVARTGIAGLLIGNTAEAIIDQLECAMLAIKPAGFVSPVTVDVAGE